MFAFGKRALWTVQSCLRTSALPGSGSTPRLFSASAIAEAGYKIKSHQGAKKRWRSLGSGGAFKRGRAGHSHLNVNKSPGQKNRLSTTAYSTPTQTHTLKKVLLPYGTS